MKGRILSLRYLILSYIICTICWNIVAKIQIKLHSTSAGQASFNQDMDVTSPNIQRKNNVPLFFNTAVVITFFGCCGLLVYYVNLSSMIINPKVLAVGCSSSFIAVCSMVIIWKHKVHFHIIRHLK